jgi:hypothetical protein
MANRPIRRRTSRGARTAKVTVTVPTDLIDAATSNVEAGRSPSLSAYLSDALAKQVAADREQDGLIALLDRLDEELGPPTAAEYAWARRFVSQ